MIHCEPVTIEDVAGATSAFPSRRRQEVEGVCLIFTICALTSRCWRRLANWCASRRPVSLDHELADVAATLERQGGPAPLFDQVDTQRGATVFIRGRYSRRRWRTRQRAALALGCDKAQVVEVMRRALDPRPGHRAGAHRAGRLEGQRASPAMRSMCTKLPIPIHATGDGGPFITGGVTVSKDPSAAAATCRTTACRSKGRARLGFNVNEWRHVRAVHGRARRPRMRPLPIAIAIGLDPAISIAAGARYDGDELFIAGAIRGEGVPVEPGRDGGHRHPGRGRDRDRGRTCRRTCARAKARWRSSTAITASIWDSPVFEVTAICWRDEPIFQTIIPGWNEHVYIGNVLPREPLLLNFVRHVSKNVTGLHIAPYGSGFLAIVALNKKNPGEPKNVALAVFTAHVNVKWCIVVDRDVDIYDPADVLWALTTRVDWSKDIFLVPGAQGHEMDPTADTRGVHTKIGDGCHGR